MVLAIDPQVTQGIKWLQSQSKQTRPDFSAIIRLDTALSEKNEELYDRISWIYESDVKKYHTESFLSGRTITVRRYTADDPEGVWSFFQTVRTYIRPEIDYLTDVVTVGILRNSVIHDLESFGEHRRSALRHYLQKSLNLVVEETPVISEPLQDGDSVNPSESPLIFFLQPDSDPEIFSDLGEIHTNATHQFYRANSQLLHGIGFSYTIDTCFIRTTRRGYLISPQHYRVLWGPITVISTSFSGKDDRKFEPSWLTGIRSLLPFFRRHNWVLYRKKELEHYDRRTYSTSELFSGRKGGASDVKRTYEDELNIIRNNWIEISRTTDELEYLGENATPSIKRSANFASEDLVPPPTDHLIEREMGLVESYRSDLSTLFKELKNDIARGERKQSQIAGFLHDSVTARSTEVSLSLERRVEILTWVLTILTVVLVIDGLGLTSPLFEFTSDVIQSVILAVAEVWEEFYDTLVDGLNL